MEIQQQCKVFGDEHAITSRRNVIKTIIFRKLQTLWTFGTRAPLAWIGVLGHVFGMQWTKYRTEDRYILGIKINICG